MKKNRLFVVALIVALSATPLVPTSSNVSSYDPWLDLNDDGVIDANDLYILASIYSSSGDPINKTALLLELQDRVDSLNKSLLSDYYDISDSDDRFVNVPGDTMTGALSVPSIYTPLVRTASAPDYDKLRVWDSPYYTMGMYGGMTSGFLNGYATTFTMYDTPSYGWVWRGHTDSVSDGAMSLTTDGRLYVKNDTTFNGNVGIGTTSPTARLHATGGTSGVRGEGSNYGGYFEDTDSTGYAYLGYGNYGVQGFGSYTGGYFKDTDHTGYAYLGQGNYGVRGFGSTAGGYFSDTDDTSYAYLGNGIYGVYCNGSYGIYARGDTMGGYFYDNGGTSRVYLAYGPYGVHSDLGTKNYFAGAVGIGTTSPQGRLHATGDLIGVFGEGSIYGARFEGNYGTVSYGSTMGGYFEDTDDHGTAYLGYGDYAIYTDYSDAYFGGNVGIGQPPSSDPNLDLDVAGYVRAYGYITSDIIFQKEDEDLWRMFEEEDGLYVESLKTGKVYSFVLQEVESGKLVESNNSNLELSGLHMNATTGLAGLAIALGLVFGLVRYRAKNSKEEIDPQQTKLSQWQ